VEAIKGEEMETQVQGLAQTLQMTVVEATAERVVMTMPVTAQHLQPWGYLHGGASVALAETAATVGAFLNCPSGMVAFGQEVNANHIRSVREGLLTATAIPLHIGRTSQVWAIEIRNEQNKLICVSRCTLAVIASDSPGETK
jgi:1,4-dihydroxy-2-naphthoyl-CoA hydrolase